MPYQHPILEIDADFGSGPVTGVFEFFAAEENSFQVEESIRTGPIVSGAGNQALSILQGILNDGESKRKGITLDFGGGQHIFEISAQTWPNMQRPDGGDAQWGASSDPSVLDATSATGADPYQQQQVFMNYLRVSQTDSLSPARLKFGEYHPDGILDDELEVVIEDPTAVINSDSPTTMDFSLTLVETLNLEQVLDGKKRSPE